MSRTSAFVAAAAAMAIAAPAAAGPWGGFYAGIHAGWGVGETEWDFDVGGLTADHDIEGALGGAQLGYNYEWGQFVLGGEVDAQLMGVGGGSPCPSPDYSCDSELEYGGSARLRAGYATGAWLVYATGGVAAAQSNAQTYLVAGGDEFSGDETYIGWTAGAGVEYIWTPAISVRGEWRYTDLGSESRVVSVFDETADLDHKYHQFTIGLNWHF